MGHILIKNLSKDFVDRRRSNRPPDGSSPKHRRVEVLENLNLEFQEGDLTCILGASGCGKSTLLRIIAGFDQPTSGAVYQNGRQLIKPSSDNIFVYQHNGLLPWMTVWQNVELGLRHMEEGEAKVEHIQEYIEMVDLEGFEHHYPHQLSGGMQRRAELARGLAVNPNMLILDEPFSGLDFLTHMKMREEVVNMHQFFQKTMIMVTHNIDDALIMGDRVVILGDRPAQVKLDQKLEFEHPRNPEVEPALQELRDEIFLMLGVSYAV
ncbi:MAG: ABC transporter ATP-binding protein [Thermodesulfobacteriota bacterium]